MENDMRTRRLTYFIAAVMAVLAVSCNKTSENEVAEPIPVIIDGDWGSSTDDLFALDVLEKAADEGLVDIKAVMADREGAHFYAVMDLMNCWYDRAAYVGCLHSAATYKS